MDNLSFKFYIPLSKKNSEQKIVEGVASSEALDSQGEVVKFEAIERALPDYMKFANVREMHQPSAVGKAISATVDKAKKALYITAKVVDPLAWEKVKEGVYNGFSIGGRVLKRINNVIHELSLYEISLVDRPANPDAVFALYKVDSIGKDGVMAEPTEAPESNDKPDKEENIMLASEILSLARQICYLCEYYEQKGKDSSKLEEALNLLSDLAQQALAAKPTESKDMQDINDAISMIDIQKKKMSSQQRKNLPKTSFAYVDSKGGTHLPINDEAHVRNAIARFGQTQFESSEAKAKAARKILAAASRYGIQVADDAAVRQSAKSYYISGNTKPDLWVNGYFEDIQMLLR
jgi:phage head maturation protease